MTATVETVSEQFDLGSIIPSDKTIVRSTTISDPDGGSVNASFTRNENGIMNGSNVAGENGSVSEESDEDDDGEEYWHTSVGKFKFSLDQLPQTLQFIHQLLTEIPTIKKPEILYYVLQCLNVMVLHGDALAKAAREHRGFFIWCQENLLIKNLWELCNAEHSHICQAGVPLLLHCITLPLGSDVFWRVVQEAFHDNDWRIRFTAVERVTVITRFMDSTPLRSEVGLQTALATAFCHLIASMDDMNVYVAQRATLYIGTIHDTAIRSLLFCLESQFDLFIVDRPVVLQSVYQLHNSLSDRRILTWEFFLNRFDTLFVEAQVNLEKCGDISYLRDLRNSENGSEALSTKILKAREALSQSDTSGSMAKTLSASFGTKWPYKRTMSAPASMIPRQDSKFVQEKEKIYSRQVSAPLLKRKTSRFGLGQFLGTNGSHINTTVTSFNWATSSFSSPPNRSTGHGGYAATNQFSYISNIPNNNPCSCVIHHSTTNTTTNINTNTTATSTIPINVSHEVQHYVVPATYVCSSNVVSSKVNTITTLASVHSQSHQLIAQSPMPTLKETARQQISQPTTQIHHSSYHHAHHAHFQKHTSAPNLFPPLRQTVANISPTSPIITTTTTTTNIPNVGTAFTTHCTCDVGCGSFTLPVAPATQDGHIHSLGGINDDNLFGLLSRITELEESDRETIHLLVFLLMQFMSRTDQAYPSEDKPMTRTQNIVLKHLFLLLGHNQIDKTFHITPEALRASAVFNAFLANLAQVLDHNHLIGGLILPSILQIILYAPNPNNSAADCYQNLIFNYSLWYMEYYARRNWMFTILVVLYKYSYTQPPYSAYLISAMRIVLNSLRGHFHQCRRIPTTTILDIHDPSRSRDASQPSLGTDPEDKDQSPPASPMFPSEGNSGASKSKGQNVAFTPKLQHAFRKYTDSSLDADETESELVAIPESDLSDSTLHGDSAPGSFDEAMQFEDLKHDSLQGRGLRSNEHFADKTNKTPKSMITTKTGDTYTTKIKSTPTAHHSRHSLQEGVRMIVSPLISAEQKETVSSSACIDIARFHTKRHKSIENAAASTSKMFAAIATNHLKALDALEDITTKSTGNTSKTQEKSDSIDKTKAKEEIVKPISKNEEQIGQLMKKAIGHHKIIVECNAGNSTSSSTYNEDIRLNAVGQKKSTSKYLKNSEQSFGSPDSPLSKMSVMTIPKDETDEVNLPGPKQITTLEIPTPERLLPIGPQESVIALVERVREGLNLPDISHLKQDSLDVSDSTKDDVTPSSRTVSPRRLIKQVALESPPNPAVTSMTANVISQDPHTSILKNVTAYDSKYTTGQLQQVNTKIDFSVNNGKRGARQKLMPFTVDSTTTPDIRSRFAGSWAQPPTYIPSDMRDEGNDELPDNYNDQGTSSHTQPNRNSSKRVGDYTVCERCSECGAAIEEYSDEEIGILIVIIGTFVHREPAMAAPFLPDILNIVSKISLTSTHAWQGENGVPLGSTAQAVALQFLRCVLHQLAPNGIFLQVFQTQVKYKIRQNNFRSIVKALQDFPDLNTTSPIYMVCETLQSRKSLPLEQMPVIFRNFAEYLQYCPVEAGPQSVWSQAMQAMEALLRQVIVIMPTLSNHEYLLNLMIATLRLNIVPKTLLDPYSKILGYCTQNIHLEYSVLYDLCTLNARSFAKDRDKMLLCRQLIFEFVQALKFKISIPDHNLLMIIGFVLHDAGGNLTPGTLPELPEAPPVLTTNSADCLRQYTNDVIDFLADFHTLSKIKNLKNGQSQTGLGEDTLGGFLKGGVAQFLALEMSRGNSRDHKTVSRYLPWLYNPPSSLQQGPKEFTECVGHMRLLSWLLLGSLTHLALTQRRLYHQNSSQQIQAQQVAPTGSGHGHGHHQNLAHQPHGGFSISQPVPQEASCHIADHIQVIFAGFAEQSKTSVLHMSSLFHAFTLCQLWTVYLEQIVHTPTNTDGNTMGILFEFWAKVTPCILQLVSHSKPAKESPADYTQNTNAKLSEMVNLHFLSLLEALKETNSTILGKLLPLWSPVLSSQSQLSDTLHVRLQNVRDYAPDYEEQQTSHSEALLKWLTRLQFKMGQIELQASTATQFYSI